MKDFSFWMEYEGAAEGSGRSEKLWLKNPDTGQMSIGFLYFLFFLNLKRIQEQRIMFQNVSRMIWQN